MSSQTEHLFVYCTLRAGYPNQHILDSIGGNRQSASLCGDLIESGWGAAFGCPGLVLNPEGTVIKGEVFSSVNLCKYWDELDAFEGNEYQRVEAEVALCNGKVQLAWVYVVKLTK